MQTPWIKCCALLALAASLHAHGAEQGVPLDDFVREDQFSQPRLAPDGKHIAIIVKLPQGDRFVPTVTLYSLPELKIVGAIRMSAFEVPLYYDWVSNTRLVLKKGLELGAREQPVPTGEVLAFDIDGGKQEYLYGYKMFKSSSQGQRFGNDNGFGSIQQIPVPHNGHVLVSSHTWDSQHSMLYDINSMTAARKLLADIATPDLTFIQQSKQKPRFAYGFDERADAVLYRRDDASGAWSVVAPAAKGQRLFPIVFTPDDSMFYANYSDSGGPFALVRQDSASGARQTVLAHPQGNINMIEYNSARQPFAAGSRIGIPVLRYFNATDPDAQLHKNLSAQFPGSIVRFINYTEDGGKLLFAVYSDRDPGSYFLYDKASNKADLLFSSMPQIDPEQMAERRPIHFKARDGLDLYGYLTLPKHAPERKLPMVLLPHDGPNGFIDNWHYHNDAQFLASRGYAVLQINFRGSDGRGKNFLELGYRQWGAKIQDDLADGVKWAIGQGEVDANRVCVYGFSFGAYSAMMLAAREGALFKCAVAYAGLYDLALLYERPDINDSKRAKNGLITVIGQNPAELARFSPTTLAANINIPVLLVHGEKDQVAPLKHAETMRAALLKANKTLEWMQVANEDHGFYDTGNVKAFYQRLENFLERHIGH